MSSADLIVIAIITAMAIGAIYVLWSNHRKGRSSCGCNCSGCSKACTRRASVVRVEDDETCDCCRKD